MTNINMDTVPWASSKVTLKDDDLLATIFEGQRELMERYHGIEQANLCVVIEEEMRGQLDDREVQMRLKDLSQRTVGELMEAMQELKNKPWKQTEKPTDKDAFYEELADTLHFFVELCITAGLTADELFLLYFQKHAINQTRQETQY